MAFSDLQFTNYNKAKVKFSKIISIAKKHNPDIIIIAGDIDYGNSKNPIHNLQDRLIIDLSKISQYIVIIPGNRDKFYWQHLIDKKPFKDYTNIIILMKEELFIKILNYKIYMLAFCIYSVNIFNSVRREDMEDFKLTIKNIKLTSKPKKVYGTIIPSVKIYSAEIIVMHSSLFYHSSLNLHKFLDWLPNKCLLIGGHTEEVGDKYLNSIEDRLFLNVSMTETREGHFNRNVYCFIWDNKLDNLKAIR